MTETSKNQRKKSLLGQLNALEVGEELTVSVSRSSYLKSICVSFGLSGTRSLPPRRTASNAQSQQPEFRNIKPTPS